MIKNTESGFTLIETLVAVTILTISIIAPMTLASQAISDAYYSRDQVVVANLAQEAIETVRATRDSNVLQIARTAGSSTIGLFDPLQVGHYYLVDPTQAVGSVGVVGSSMFVDCNTAPCATPLRTNGVLYGYNSSWSTPTSFIRYIYIRKISDNEIRVDATVLWRTNFNSTRTFTISENLFRWVVDGSGT